MNCPRPDLLMVLDEDVLPPSVAGGVRAHLETCALCRQLRHDLLHPSLTEPTLDQLNRLRTRVLPEPRARASARWLKWGGAVAAALVAAAGLYFAVPARQPVPVVAVKPPAYRLPLAAAPLRLPLAAAVVLRGQTATADPGYLADLGKALQPYHRGAFDVSTKSLAALAQRYPQAVEPKFYEGVSRLLAGDAAGATASLEAARKIGGEALQDDIDWYLAVTSERAGRWTEALALLAPLCRGEGAYRAAACAGLGR